MDSDVIPMEGCNVEFVSPAKRGVESHVTFAPETKNALIYFIRPKMETILGSYERPLKSQQRNLMSVFKLIRSQPRNQPSFYKAWRKMAICHLSSEYSGVSGKGACKKSQKKGKRNTKSLSKRWKLNLM
ncbi:uncharacterized protein [Ptychodera flava]|uniref:uncharacterized protein n=1 Tax=Ptychodera flava TaxID=63121 RepID=UPI003969E7EA